jgi:DtxR family Mn-dependent transcriptional regulator/ferrous iron transport protein A
MPLHRLKPGRSAQVVELRSSDAARLDRLSAYGLVPGSIVYMQQLRPALILRIGETEISLDQDVARDILIDSGDPGETVSKTPVQAVVARSMPVRPDSD